MNSNMTHMKNSSFGMNKLRGTERDRTDESKFLSLMLWSDWRDQVRLDLLLHVVQLKRDTIHPERKFWSVTTAWLNRFKTCLDGPLQFASAKQKRFLNWPKPAPFSLYSSFSQHSEKYIKKLTIKGVDGVLRIRTRGHWAMAAPKAWFSVAIATLF